MSNSKIKEPKATPQTKGSLSRRLLIGSAALTGIAVVTFWPTKPSHVISLYAVPPDQRQSALDSLRNHPVFAPHFGECLEGFVYDPDFTKIEHAGKAAHAGAAPEHKAVIWERYVLGPPRARENKDYAMPFPTGGVPYKGRSSIIYVSRAAAKSPILSQKEHFLSLIYHEMQHAHEYKNGLSAGQKRYSWDELPCILKQAESPELIAIEEFIAYNEQINGIEQGHFDATADFKNRLLKKVYENVAGLRVRTETDPQFAREAGHIIDAVFASADE